MKDFLGKELSLGDEVVFTAPSYRHLVKGKIIAFTKTKVRVEYMNTWNFTTPGYKDEYLAEPSFLILSKKCTWPNVQHESHKSVRSSDASTFDFICDDCGATDDVTSGWGGLRKPCKAADPKIEMKPGIGNLCSESVAIDSDGFIIWNGNADRPVSDDTIIAVKVRSGIPRAPIDAAYWPQICWRHRGKDDPKNGWDIMAYKVVENV